MNRVLLGLFIGVFVLVLASSVSAQEAVIKTVVDNGGCPLIADNRTEYKLNVHVDNTELNEATDGVQWRVLAPQGVDFNVTRVNGTENNRPENDFFAGKSMFWELVRPEFNHLHARLADLGQGVLDGRGNVVTYTFTISSVSRPMRTNFGLDAVVLVPPEGQQSQQFRIENQPFVILPDNFPAMSAKCAR